MSRTYEVQEMVNLALAYKDPEEWFAIDEIFVPNLMETEKGKYRVDDALSWYQRYDFHLGKEGYTKAVDIADSFIEWATEPRGRHYPILFSHLKDYKSRGYSSAEQMKQDKWEFLIHVAKINKEIAGITQIEASANYDAANLHTIAAGDFASSLAWSNDNSTPINDVDFLIGENPRANTIAMSWTTKRDLMNNPQILDYGSITASDRDNMSPKVSTRYLEACFGLRVVVFMAEAVTAATADLPLASQAKAQMWGDYVWVGLVNKESKGPRIARPTWGHQYIFAPMADDQGWIMKETIDEEAGLVGMLKLVCGYFNQFKFYAKSYGQKLAGVN